MSQSLVTAKRLADWLRIDTETLRKWRVNGFFPGTTTLRGSVHYSTASIDAFLERGARNFAEVPTTAQLQSGALKLLRADEACERLGISPDVLYTRVRTRRLSAIKLLDSLRIDAASVEAYLAASRDTNLIPRTRAAHVVGAATLFLIRQWVYSGELTCAEVPHNQHLRPVTRASLLTLLAKLLPDWIDPNDWLEDRLEDNRPLMHLKDLQPYLGFDTRGQQAHALMDAQRLEYLRLPGGELKFSPISVDAQLETEPILTLAQIGKLFGVSRTATRIWRDAGHFACTLHIHDGLDELFRPCLLEILRTCLDPHLPARGWYDWRMRTDERLITEHELAEALGIPHSRVPELVASGIVRGIREPRTKSYRRFSLTQIDRARTKLGGAA